MDPAVKHLAMMVEDHPYDYRTFEGIIPKGNYGAGTVIVWDEGTYEAAEINFHDKKQQEKDLLHQLYSGKLKFILHGKKLKGEFALVKTATRGDNAWLLMKLKDKFATTDDIIKKDKSVVSNKTIEQITKTSRNIWKSNRPEVKNAKTSRQERIAKKKATEQEESNIKTKDQNADIESFYKKQRKLLFPPI